MDFLIFFLNLYSYLSTETGIENLTLPVDTRIWNNCLCHSGNKVSYARGGPRDETTRFNTARVRLTEQSSAGVQPDSIVRRSSHKEAVALSACCQFPTATKLPYRKQKL